MASASGSGSYEWRFHVLAVDRPTGSVLVSAGGASCGAPANVGYQASRFSWCTPLRGLANPISAVVVRVEARIFGSAHRSSSGVSPFGERPPLVAPFGWSWVRLQLAASVVGCSPSRVVRGPLWVTRCACNGSSWMQSVMVFEGFEEGQVSNSMRVMAPRGVQLSERETL